MLPAPLDRAAHAGEMGRALINFLHMIENGTSGCEYDYKNRASALCVWFARQ
jgi:hypothetical protein